MPAPIPTLPDATTSADLLARWIDDATTSPLDLRNGPAPYQMPAAPASSHTDDIDVVDETLEALLDDIWDGKADDALDRLYELGALTGPAYSKVVDVVEETIAEGDLDAAAATCRALHRRHLAYRFARAMLTRIGELDSDRTSGDPDLWADYTDILIAYICASWTSRHNGWWRNVNKVAGMADRGTPTMKLVAAAVAASHRARDPDPDVEQLTGTIVRAGQRTAEMADRTADLTWVADLVADLAGAVNVDLAVPATV